MPGNICCDTPKATPSFWETLGQSDRSWGQGLQTCWTLAAQRHQGEGESAAGAIGTAGQGAFLPQLPRQHPAGCSVSLLTLLARSLCPPPREQLFSKQSGKGKQFTGGESTVCSNTLLRQLSCHKGWELFGCSHSAQPHHLSLCQGTDTPIFIISSREVIPLTSQTEHTRAAAEWIVGSLRGGHSDTVLGNHARTGVIPHEHGSITTLEDSLGQYVSKPIPSLAVGDVMAVH